MKKSVVRSARSSDLPNVEALRSSPVHDLIPLNGVPISIDIHSIEIDPTNPGGVTESMRYQRRAPSIHDSYDILNRIVYPILVCVHPEKSDKYMHIDGFGRLDEAHVRGQKKILAIVYPPLSLEQRICLRQTLNAAQEAFDAASIIEIFKHLPRNGTL